MLGLFLKLLAAVVIVPPFISWLQYLVKKHYKRSLPLAPTNHKNRPSLLAKRNDKGQYVRTLHVRKVNCKGGNGYLLEGGQCGNEFFEEYNLCVTVSAPPVDLGVTKHVREALPIISEQEEMHAIHHNRATKEYRVNGAQAGEEPPTDVRRWTWFKNILNFLFHRCGTELSIVLTGYFEITSWCLFYYMAPYGNNLGIYHAIEELEHDIITCDYLASRTNLVMRLITFPVVALCWVIILFMPPLMRLAVKPQLLLSPKTLPNLVHYYALTGWIFALTISSMFINWVLLIPFYEPLHEGMYLELLDLAERRGVTFEVLKKADCVIGKYSSPHKNPPRELPHKRRSSSTRSSPKFGRPQKRPASAAAAAGIASPRGWSLSEEREPSLFEEERELLEVSMKL